MDPFPFDTETLRRSLVAQLSTAEADWLAGACDAVDNDGRRGGFFIRFNQVVDRIGEDGPIDAYPWLNHRDAARIVLINAVSTDPSDTRILFGKLLSTGTVEEAESLLRGLAFYPQPETYARWAMDGVRSNMASVVKAIAFDNPYPSRYFDEKAWNQMVLKLLFLDQLLDAVFGFEARMNQPLRDMIGRFVEERRAAGREVPTSALAALGLQGSPPVH